ncbi:HAD family acid phosphatase [Maridesulfovibrio frigidus]|uniref:HAD family acid phosphatase n=1 Tax=Maridesulfovibrio frigidus TaxID=340956 RepID=UPI0004E192E6|nr:HAD family acid phosphatase [Maridesulfovibrio frigidus]
MFARIFIILLILNVAGCVSTTAKRLKDTGQMVSIPDARTRVLEYHESGQYLLDVQASVKEIADAVEKAVVGGMKYPAVVMSVEDVLVSTYKIRKKQGFSDNVSGRKEVDSNVILGILPVLRPTLELYDSLLMHNVPVFLISHRPENMRVSILENLAGVGYSGWSGLYLLPPKYEKDSSGFYEEVCRGLSGTGINIVARVGVIQSDTAGAKVGTAFLYPNYIYSSR